MKKYSWYPFWYCVQKVSPILLVAIPIPRYQQPCRRGAPFCSCGGYYTVSCPFFPPSDRTTKELGLQGCGTARASRVMQRNTAQSFASSGCVKWGQYIQPYAQWLATTFASNWSGFRHATPSQPERVCFACTVCNKLCGKDTVSAITASMFRYGMVSRHFRPRTLRTQDISALVPKCPDISALVPKSLTDTSAPRKTLQHQATLAKLWQGGRLCLHNYAN